MPCTAALNVFCLGVNCYSGVLQGLAEGFHKDLLTLVKLLIVYKVRLAL